MTNPSGSLYVDPSAIALLAPAWHLLGPVPLLPYLDSAGFLSALRGLASRPLTIPGLGQLSVQILG